eukprot:31274-Pelagococcus_subviridis.AAC.12
MTNDAYERHERRRDATFFGFLVFWFFSRLFGSRPGFAFVDPPGPNARATRLRARDTRRTTPRARFPSPPPAPSSPPSPSSSAAAGPPPPPPPRADTF